MAPGASSGRAFIVCEVWWVVAQPVGTTVGGHSTALLSLVSPKPPSGRRLPVAVLVAGDYVGRPVAEVAAELTGLGLVPQLQPVQTADAPEGEVTGVAPLTALVTGSTVTVSHAVAPAPPPAQAGDDDADDADRGKDDNGKGDNGKGDNGKGRGKGEDDD